MTDKTRQDSGSTHIIRYALELGLLWIDGDGRDKVREALDALNTLEAQLEAIGAGGVSGPLVGQPQAMPDWVQYEETSDVLIVHGKRYAAGIFGKAGFLGPPGTLLRVECGDADCVTLARVPPSANAGEPRKVFLVATGEDHEGEATYTRYDDKPPPLCDSECLFAAPPTAQAEGWTKLPGQLPEPGMPVLLDIGNKYPIRAMWAAKHTVQAADDDTDRGEYVEADDMYYAPEGWYEWNQCEENHWRVTETPRAWMPLPPTSAEGVEHG